MCGQEAGTKQYCIEQLKKKGAYPNDHVLMIGDAPGDLKAAEENDVLYYPIIPSKEEESWERFINEAFDKFIEGTYRGEYQEKLIQEFFDVLK